jgi:Holliday junction resolvase RusA-like endonuclease
MIVSKEAKDYKAAAGWLAKASGAELLECPVAVVVRLYRPQRSGDLDNRLKVLLDALSGILYDDDKRVVEIHAYRYEDKANPRAEVEVKAA